MVLLWSPADVGRMLKILSHSTHTHPAVFEQGDVLPSRFSSPTVSSLLGHIIFASLCGGVLCDFAVQHGKKLSIEVLPGVLKHSEAVMWLAEEKRMLDLSFI